MEMTEPESPEKKSEGEIEKRQTQHSKSKKS